jgi:hypothetical protein
MEFQTRSESTGLRFFTSLEEAWKHYESDPTVWKISFDSERWVTKTINEKWNPVSEEKLQRLSIEYRECKDSTQLFWVLQDMMPSFENRNLPCNERMASCIQNIVTHEGMKDRARLS